MQGDELIALVRDLETRLIRVPAGIQDYYPPVYGGLMAIHLNPGAVVRHQIALPVDRLAEHMLLHYTGVAHFSGTNNWDIYKRQIDGKKKVHKGLDKIAESAIEMEKALESGDMEAAGVALGHEWQNRKALIDGISTPEIESAIAAAIEAGAWAGKVCGAGGGGCIVFLMPPDRRDAVRAALANVPGEVIDAQPVAHGLTVERSDDAPLRRPRFTDAQLAVARTALRLRRQRRLPSASAGRGHRDAGRTAQRRAYGHRQSLRRADALRRRQRAMERGASRSIRRRSTSAPSPIRITTSTTRSNRRR